MTTGYQIVYCTCPDHATAEKIATQLVKEKLAACINIIPHLTSIYHWKGEVKKGNEVLMMIKTHTDKMTLLEETIIGLHPYDFPELISINIESGNRAYLEWVHNVVHS